MYIYIYIANTFFVPPKYPKASAFDYVLSDRFLLYNCIATSHVLTVASQRPSEPPHKLTIMIPKPKMRL